jgi:hypothetical protein
MPENTNQPACEGSKPDSEVIPDIALPKGQGRRCEGISKKTGERCTAWAMQGSTLCRGHAAPPEHLAKARAKSAEVRKRVQEERPRSLKDALAKALEAHADEIIASYMTAIRQDGGWRAAEALLSRVHGTPTQRIETEDKTKDVDQMSLSELVSLCSEALLRESDVSQASEA